MVRGEEMLRSTTTKHQRHTMNGGRSCSKACIGSTFNHKGYQKSPRKCELFSLEKLVRLATNNLSLHEQTHLPKGRQETDGKI